VLELGPFIEFKFELRLELAELIAESVCKEFGSEKDTAAPETFPTPTMFPPTLEETGAKRANLVIMESLMGEWVSRGFTLKEYNRYID